MRKADSVHCKCCYPYYPQKEFHNFCVVRLYRCLDGSEHKTHYHLHFEDLFSLLVENLAPNVKINGVEAEEVAMAFKIGRQYFTREVLPKGIVLKGNLNKVGTSCKYTVYDSGVIGFKAEYEEKRRDCRRNRLIAALMNHIGHMKRRDRL